MSGGKLPEGWVKSDLDNILLSIIGGGTPSKAIPEYYQGDIPWMSVKDMNKHALTDTVDHITSDAVENSSTNIIPAGTPIIATRMSLGKIVTASFDSAINQDLKALFLSSGVERDFFIHWYRSQAQLIESLGTGTTVKGIRLEVLKALTINLPSLAEQKIIAEKVDTLLAQVDSTKARLEQIPQILKRFRQAMLATAMSGKLTNLPTANNLKIKDIACVIGGLTKNSKRNNFELKVPYLRVANVYENELKLDDVAEIGVQPNELRRVSLEYEDLLIVEGNGSLDQIGRAALWREEIQECVHQNHLIKVRTNKEILYPTFLLFYLMSPQGKEEIVNRATSGAGLYTLSISKISSINVPVYSLPEQQEIVRRVEQLFAYADTIEKQVNNALTRVNNLTQSILAKAFRGELTAQWRAENPDLISGENSAAALQEKIKAERAASGGKKTSRKKS